MVNRRDKPGGSLLGDYPRINGFEPGQKIGVAPNASDRVNWLYKDFMRVTVHYLAQIKRAAGCGSETVETNVGCSLRGFLKLLADQHDPTFRTMLLDDAEEPRRSLLFFVGEELADLSRQLTDGDEVTILAPMAGGSQGAHGPSRSNFQPPSIL
ncbi:MAG: MoaD/ThiS family protein [Planctomycetes bacterium]|nr:MoaD/ThiS family protein [Planctomycetota bacterium]